MSIASLTPVDLHPVPLGLGALSIGVVCPTCEEEWNLEVELRTALELSKNYGAKALTDRLEVLESDLPEVQCAICLLHFGVRDA